MMPSSAPTPEFDDRKPLAIGCLIALVAVAVLSFAFLLGAWSVLQEQNPNASAPPAKTPAAHP